MVIHCSVAYVFYNQQKKNLYLFDFKNCLFILVIRGPWLGQLDRGHIYIYFVFKSGLFVGTGLGSWMDGGQALEEPPVYLRRHAYVACRIYAYI